MMPGADLSFFAVPDLPIISPGDDLAMMVVDAIETAHFSFEDDDIVVFAQKIVSKAEARFVDLDSVEVSSRARELAAIVNKDARLVETILSESSAVIRAAPGVLIVRHRDGFIMANAGVDRSNVGASTASERVLLLPRDSDASARRLRAALQARSGKHIGVIINDSFGRPWRRGTVGVAIGAAGLPATLDMRGQPDLFGRALRVTETGFADEIAAAASLLMGQANEGRPVVVVRGLRWSAPPTPAVSIARRPEQDLFL